ncbi:hypothetical protein MPH_02113 [Macrophomina phaseolina MS6]|uniref:Uncharacterized protein n=1 Tax=Macrophomina phaseolina (strain MS6) TaxID=1126212 RepID=K2RDK3_MACPH|nr:hypothetical protein MPH_02113 [Macrophomina phaseolina MS6]
MWEYGKRQGGTASARQCCQTAASDISREHRGLWERSGHRRTTVPVAASLQGGLSREISGPRSHHGRGEPSLLFGWVRFVGARSVRVCHMRRWFQGREQQLAI